MDHSRTNSATEIISLLLQRHAWLIGVIITCLLTSLLAFIYALPNLYKSSASIAVEAKHISTEVVPSAVTSGPEGRVRILSQRILSRERLRQLATQFGLYPELMHERESSLAIADAVRGDIGLLVHNDGSFEDPNVTFEVSFSGTNPEKVQQVADALALFFIDENVKDRKKQTLGTAEFLRSQLKETQEKLEVQERALAEYKQRNIEVLPEQLAGNLGRLSQLRSDLSATSAALAAAQERRDVIARRLAFLSGTTVDAPLTASERVSPAAHGQPNGGSVADQFRDPAVSTVLSAVAQLETLKARLGELLVRLSDKHPDVIQTRKEIAALEEKIKTLPAIAVPANSSVAGATGTSVATMQPAQVVNAAAESARRATELTSLQTEQMTLEAEIGRRTLAINHLQKEITLYQERVERTPQRDQEMQRLTRDYTTTHELYLSLLKRLDNAMLAGNLEESPQAEKFQVLEPARFPEDPVGPRRKLLSIGALILSLGIAAVAVLFREVTTPVFHTIEELRAFTTVEILGSVPRITTQKELTRQRVRQCTGVVALCAVLFTLAIVAQNLATGNAIVARALTRSGGGIQAR